MNPIIKKPSAWIPIVMSFAILAILLGYLARFGVVHDTDEGTAAHLFQIWLVLEVLAVALFATNWLPRNPRQALVVLVLQIVSALLPMSVVFFLNL